MELERIKYFRRACLEGTGFRQTVHADDDEHVIIYDFPKGWKKKVGINLLRYLLKHVREFTLIDDSIQSFRSENDKAFLCKEVKKMKYKDALLKRLGDIVAPIYHNLCDAIENSYRENDVTLLEPFVQEFNVKLESVQDELEEKIRNDRRPLQRIGVRTSLEINEGVAHGASGTTVENWEGNAHYRDNKRNIANGKKPRIRDIGLGVHRLNQHITSYCVKCKKIQPLIHTEPFITSNHRHALRGTCGVCGTKLIRFIKKSEGEGILNSLKSAAKGAVNYVKTVVTGRKDDFPPKVRSILEKYGDARISFITINRTPVPSLITGILKAVSNVPYDKLFHLFLTLHTDKGNLLIEKNDVINMEVNPKNRPETESMGIPSIFPITLNDLIDETKSSMGDKFFRYSAYDTNCQHFVLALLKSCRITDSKYTSFVKQDTASIFKTNPALRRFANTVTDIAGRADVALHGVGF